VLGVPRQLRIKTGVDEFALDLGHHLLLAKYFSEADLIFGEDGADTVNGDDGDDTDNGGTRVDIIHGNAGVDTRVHVFASRFLPAFDAFSALGDDRLPQPQAWTSAYRPSLYQSARTIGEEYRYVLERRGAKHYAGNLLPRPGLLLNPWAISDTATEKQNAAAGEDAAPMQAGGFRSLTLDKPALDAGRIAIAQASGIFPDGTPFAVPDTMSAPAPVPIKPDMAGLVTLAIPIERPGAATIDPAHGDPAGSRYHGVIQTVRAAIRGGATLVHATQMMNHVKKVSF